MVPRAPLWGAGLLHALALSALPHSDTGAVWRLSRCSLVFCFSLDVTGAYIRSVSGMGGVSFMSWCPVGA